MKTLKEIILEQIKEAVSPASSAAELYSEMAGWAWSLLDDHETLESFRDAYLKSRKSGTIDSFVKSVNDYLMDKNSPFGYSHFDHTDSKSWKGYLDDEDAEANAKLGKLIVKMGAPFWEHLFIQNKLIKPESKKEKLERVISEIGKIFNQTPTDTTKSLEWQDERKGKYAADVLKVAYSKLSDLSKYTGQETKSPEPEDGNYSFKYSPSKEYADVIDSINGGGENSGDYPGDWGMAWIRVTFKQ